MFFFSILVCDVGSLNKLSPDEDKNKNKKQEEINKIKQDEKHTSITKFFTRKKILTVTSVLLVLTTLAIVLILILNKPEGEFYFYLTMINYEKFFGILYLDIFFTN